MLHQAETGSSWLQHVLQRGSSHQACTLKLYHSQ